MWEQQGDRRDHLWVDSTLVGENAGMLDPIGNDLAGLDCDPV